MKNVFKKKNNGGFTLIESLVSIAIVLIAVMAPLTLIMNSITSVSQSKNRVVATFLAEEVIENFRAYRDGFSLACSDITTTFDSDGILIGGSCNKDNAGIPISVNYLKDSDNNPHYSNQNVAWHLFLDSLVNIINQEAYLDNNSFNFNTLGKLNSYSSCTLDLNTLTGYYCNSSNRGQYAESILLTPIDGNVLKIEVTMVYAKSYLIGVPDKSLKITDYIYER